MRKAQVQANVLIYVLAIFIAGTILLYGYTVVRGLLSTQEQVQMLDFQKQIKDEVDSLSRAYRDVEQEVVRLPTKYDEICIVDLNEKGQVLNNIPEINSRPLIRDSIEDGVKSNVFILQDGSLRGSFYTGRATTPNLFDCYPVFDGVIRLRFEALGGKVKISTWE